MSTPEPKSPRKRKTEAAKPIGPLIWLILGGLLLVIGGFIYLDPMSFAEAGQASDNSFLRIFFVILVSVLGKNPTAIVLSVLGLLSLGWGIRGWLRNKSGANSEKPV
jgi:drug/metabolite transporter (DMT)-like permease